MMATDMKSALESAMMKLKSCEAVDDPLDGPITRWGTLTLRSKTKDYHSGVRDKTGWEHFYFTWPRDYNIWCDKFNLHRSTYKRLAHHVPDCPFPESETTDALRTGYCGPSSICAAHPGVIQRIDLKPEPAYRLHLSDRIANGLSKADPLEGVIPWGKPGDMCNAKSVAHRDYKWRARSCKVPLPYHNPFEYTVHKKAKTDLHGRQDWDGVIKFEDDCKRKYLGAPLVQLKTMYHWPKSCITRWPVGGILSVHPEHPCLHQAGFRSPSVINACTEDPALNLPEDRNVIFGDRFGDRQRTKPLHYHNSSLMDAHCYNPNCVRECCERPPKC